MKYLKLSVVYLGLIIGAGFASGREILEYFVFCSAEDVTGLVAATFFFIFILYIIASTANKYALGDFNAYVEHVAGGAAFYFKIAILLTMAAGYAVMLSCSGAAARDIFGVSNLWGVLGMSALCFIIFVFDIKGFAALSLFLVPVLVIGIGFLSVAVVLTDPAQGAFLDSLFSGAVNRNALLNAIYYVSYNTLCAAAVVVPLCQSADNKKLLITCCLAGAALGLLIFLVWLALSMNISSVWYEDLPLLKLAGNYGELARYAYGLILTFAIFTTAASQGLGILSYVKTKNKLARAGAALAFCLAMIPFGLHSFSSLVAEIYRLQGLVGLVWLVMIIVKWQRRD